MNTLCGQMRNRLDGWLDGTLGKPEADRVREHLASCKACRKRLEGERRLIRELSDLPQLRCPGRVTDSILERVGAGKKKSASPAWREWIPGRRFWKPALAFGLITVLALVWKFNVPKTPKKQIPYSPEEIGQAVDAVKWSMAFSAQTIRKSGAQAIGVLSDRLPKTIRRSVRMALPADGGIEP